MTLMEEKKGKKERRRKNFSAYHRYFFCLFRFKYLNKTLPLKYQPNSLQIHLQINIFLSKRASNYSETLGISGSALSRNPSPKSWFYNSQEREEEEEFPVFERNCFHFNLNGYHGLDNNFFSIFFFSPASLSLLILSLIQSHFQTDSNLIIRSLMLNLFWKKYLISSNQVYFFCFEFFIFFISFKASSFLSYLFVQSKLFFSGDSRFESQKVRELQEIASFRSRIATIFSDFDPKYLFLFLQKKKRKEKEREELTLTSF